MTLDPGVEIWSNSGSQWLINQNGALNAVGTQADPIIMRGASQVTGYWKGLQFYFSPSTQNVLSDVVIQHGGGSGAPASIWMRCNGGSGQLTLTDSSIQSSATFGVQVDSTGCSYTEADVIYTDNVSGDFNES